MRKKTFDLEVSSNKIVLIISKFTFLFEVILYLALLRYIISFLKTTEQHHYFDYIKITCAFFFAIFLTLIIAVSFYSKYIYQIIIDNEALTITVKTRKFNIFQKTCILKSNEFSYSNRKGFVKIYSNDRCIGSFIKSKLQSEDLWNSLMLLFKVIDTLNIYYYKKMQDLFTEEAEVNEDKMKTSANSQSFTTAKQQRKNELQKKLMEKLALKKEEDVFILPDSYYDIHFGGFSFQIKFIIGYTKEWRTPYFDMDEEEYTVPVNYCTPLIKMELLKKVSNEFEYFKNVCKIELLIYYSLDNEIFIKFRDIKTNKVYCIKSTDLIKWKLLETENFSESHFCKDVKLYKVLIEKLKTGGTYPIASGS